MPIPRFSKQWTGVFPGKYAGDIWQSFNIDLEKEQGRARLGDKFRILTDGDDTAAPGLPYKFMRTNADQTDKWWCLSATKMLKTAGTNPFVAYAADGIANSPTDALDMETHESNSGYQRLIVARDADLARLQNGVWTASWWVGTLAQSALATGKPHPICRLQRLLIVGDVVSQVGAIHTIDKADVVSASRLTFAAGYEPRVIIKSSNRYWIGLQNIFGNQGLIIEWDGSSQTYLNEFPLVGSFPLAGAVVSNIPFFFDEVGYIYKYSGGSFEPVQQFPMVEEGLVFSSTVASTNTIQTNGVSVDRHLIYINVGAPTASRRMRSGIWCYNTLNRNLYHLRGIGQHKTANTDVDYGQTPFLRPGGIKYIFDGANSINDLLIGGAVYKSYSSTSKTVIGQTISNKNQASSAGRNRGYIITPYIPLKEVNAMWEGLWTKFKKFVNSNNRIIVKWRVAESLKDADGNDESVLQATGTWVSTTTFTCVVPTGVAVGHEVEVMSGDNAGCSFKISALSATPDGAATITVTISEAAPTSSTLGALFNFDNWTTETAISSTSIGNQKVPFSASAHGEFIQFKIELRGFGVELDDLEPLFKVKTSYKQS